MRRSVAPPRPSPAVTVSIVTIGNRDLLRRCLESLSAGVEDTSSLEVVVLDNASGEDASADVRDAFPDLQVMKRASRVGFGAAHNEVIESTSGRWILILNDDTTVEPGSIDRLVRYGEARARVAAVGPRIVFPDRGRHHSAWRFPGPLTSLLAALTVAQVGWVQSSGSRAKRVGWATGSALLLRREAVTQVGGFDEGFFMYAEELDLCHRLADQGWETHYFPCATIVHHRRRSSASVPDRRIVEHVRGLDRYWRKHHSPPSARIARVATGLQYAAAATLARGLLAVPERRRPLRVQPTDAAEYALYARNFLLGETGPGLREAADEWNAAHAAAGVP